MTEAVVSFLLDRISTLLCENGKLLGGLQQEVQYIKDELGHMRSFLRVAEEKEEEDPRLQEWIRQIREAAYDTEDVLDGLMLHFAHNRSNGVYGSVSRIFTSMKNVRARHQIASEIQSIKNRIVNISQAHERYQSEFGTFDRVSKHVATNNIRPYGRDDALLVDEAKLVGIDEPKRLLISQLLESDSQLKTVAVVGMGGLGKTTLVKRVHEDAEVRRQFQFRAWLTVSQTCDFQDLFKDLIQQLYEEIKKPMPSEVESMKLDRLKSFVKDFLRDKRYVIVFDDVWDIDVWNTIKFALPEGTCGSRIMLTTRIADVASASCVESRGYVYRMKPLAFEQSWILFSKKTFGENGCPTYLKDVSQRILTKCQGLPLAIIAVSGVLALKDNNNINEWEVVLRSIGSELEGNSKLDRVKRILSLSYRELPYYLKTCLLYASIFPEDYAIQCETLIQLWIAEGFVQGREGMTIEEVALSYLNELINRSLIQMANAWGDRRLKTCHIHDLLREIILSTSREHNMITIATRQFTRWPEKVRRLAIQNSIDTSNTNNRCKHLRSLLTFGSVDLLPNSLLSELLSGGSRLLKVLDLRGSQIEEIPKEVFSLFHLRYLCLKWTRVKVVSKSIGKLQNLEFLDMGNTQVSELPMDILKLQKLRHLLVYQHCCYSYSSGNRSSGAPYKYSPLGFKAPYNVGGLLSLERLIHINADNEKVIVREVGKLTRLKFLGITNLRREDGKELCSSLEKLTSLQVLHVTSVDKDEIIDLEHSLSLSLQFLQRLHLRGRLDMVPQWIPSLQYLISIELSWSNLRDDPLELLQCLPNLEEFTFNQGYLGESLCLKAGGFLKLKTFSLMNMGGLKWVKMEEGAMPHLQELNVANLKLVEELPQGIEHLRDLQSLHLYDMNEKLIAKLLNRAVENEDYRRIAHVPSVIIDDRHEAHHL